MCQPIAKMIGEAGAENLRFCFEPPERARVDDAVAVARIFAAVGVRGFRGTPAAGGRRVYSPGSVGAKRFDCRNLRRSAGAGESGLRREPAQAAVGFIGDARVRVILLDLFVQRDRFFRICLPKNAGELQKNERLRNQG